MAGRLAGKVAVITGTASGMGRATAIRFAKEGAIVYGADIDAAGNQQTADLAEAAGVKIHPSVSVDLGSPEAAQSWIDGVGAAEGRIDILFNNAGSPRFAPVPDMAIESWDHTIRNELSLVFYVTKAAWSLLAKRGGVILNSASVSAHITTRGAGMAAHCAAKGGILALSRVFASDGAPFGIRSVSISPGGIRTPELERNFLNKVPGAEEKLLSMILARRIGESDDVASMAVYLASDEASFITGADFVVDGGQTTI